MKHFLLVICLIVSTLAVQAQQSTIYLFVVETSTFDESTGQEIQEESRAVPIVMVNSGRYIGFSQENNDFSLVTISQILDSGNFLFPVSNDGLANRYLVINKRNDDYSGIYGVLSSRPKGKLLTNDSLVLTRSLKVVTKTPFLVKRKRPSYYGGGYYSDKLLGKVDLDGDNIGEHVYLCQESEGVFYQIFSFKNNQWKKVFEGGYSGL